MTDKQKADLSKRLVKRGASEVKISGSVVKFKSPDGTCHTTTVDRVVGGSGRGVQLSQIQGF